MPITMRDLEKTIFHQLMLHIEMLADTTKITREIFDRYLGEAVERTFGHV